MTALTPHEHISLFGSDESDCTPQEAANLAFITEYRAAQVADRKRFLAPNYRRHRAAFRKGDIEGGTIPLPPPAGTRSLRLA